MTERTTPDAGVPVGHQDLGRSGALMAAGTVVSRALGFVRTVVWAWALGLNIVGSSFLVANTVPNVVYALLAGGVLTAVFVPQLVAAARSGDGDAQAQRLITLVCAVLALVTALAVVSAPFVARLYAGENWSVQDVALTAAFAAWCLPQIFFYGLSAMLGQVLATRGSFAPMMWAPVVNNVIAIGVGLVFVVVGTVDTGAGAGASTSLSSAEIALLGSGATAGVAAQALILVPALRRVGFQYRPRWDWRAAGLRATGRLAGWTFGFVAVNQVAFWVVTRTANTAGAAGADAGFATGLPSYTNAFTVWMLPHAIVTVSVATALLPRMSASAHDGRLADVRADLARALRVVGVATVPAAAAFLALGPPMMRAVFFGNTADDARYMGLVLMAFAPGLVAFSAQHLVLRTFHATEDTRTPFLIQLAIAGLNIGLVLAVAALLPAQWVVVAMAGCYSLAYLVGLLVSLRALRRRLGPGEETGLLRLHLRLVASVLPAALAAAVLGWWITRATGDGVGGSIIATSTGLVILGLGYLFMARLLGVADVGDLLRTAGARTRGRTARSRD